METSHPQKDALKQQNDTKLHFPVFNSITHSDAEGLWCREICRHDPQLALARAQLSERSDPSPALLEELLKKEPHVSL